MIDHEIMFQHRISPDSYSSMVYQAPVNTRFMPKKSRVRNAEETEQSVKLTKSHRPEYFNIE